VSNVGANATSGAVTLSDALPAGLIATGLSGSGWTCTLASLTCTQSNSLAAGAAFPDITLTVNVSASAPATITNNVTVTGGGQSNSANDTGSDTVTIAQAPDVAIGVSHGAAFVQGQTGTYTLAVSNMGVGPTTAAVTVTDTLPAGLTATALSGTGWTCTLATLSCLRGDVLAGGASYPAITLTVAVSNTAPSSVTNTAAVAGGGEINTANDSASDVTPIGSAGGAPPVFVTEANFAVDRNVVGPNRADLSLNISGTNTLLIVAFHAEFDGGITTWSVTCNNVPGTMLVDTDGYVGGAGNQRFRIYYWVNPAPGAATITVQNAYQGDNELAVSAVLFANVAQTGSLGDVVLDVSTTPRTSETETVNTIASDLVVHVIADALTLRGTLSSGETSLSVANDGKHPIPGDGDASLWISDELGSFPTTTVGSSGWANGPAPAPRIINGVAIVLHSATPAPDTQAPSVPANLLVASVSSNQVGLTWNPSTDDVAVTGYRVFRNGLLVGTSAVTNFTDSGLQSSSTYMYTVAAIDAAGNISAVSLPAIATTLAADTNPPSVPLNLVSSNVTSNSATVSWSVSTDDVAVGGYRVMRNGSVVATTSQTSYNDLGLIPSTTYTYTVLAFDTSNNASLPSQGLNVTTGAGSSVVTFVQLKENRLTANSNSLSTGTFTSPIGAGHLMVVWIWYASSTRSVASVTDTLGNVYVKAVGPTTGTGGLAGQRQELWYAKNLVGGTTTAVSATFDATFNADKSITAHEYAGANQISPLDATSTVAVSGSNVSGTPVATTSPNELIFGATLFQGAGSPGSGFTQRSAIASNVSEDKMVTTAGSYASTFVNSSQAAIVQTATFRASSQPAAPPSGFAQMLALSQPDSSGGVTTSLDLSPGVSVLTPTLGQQFVVTGGSGAIVVWAVDGITGGDATRGTITPAGLYTPPGVAGTHAVTVTDGSQMASAAVYITTYGGTFTHHNDNFRTGQNLSETVLTPANVTPSTFGKLFSYALDGAALASPLYVAGVSIPGQGTRNVVYVATEHDSVYAFDADGTSATPLWQRSFLGPGVTTVPAIDTGDCCDIGPEIGITGTPVIDPSTNTLYVVARTKEGANDWVQRLHALDLGSGAEKFGGPVVIAASVPGNGDGASAGRIAFDPLRQNQRASLLLSGAVVYIGFGSHGDQQTSHHGWLLGYRASTLEQVMAFNASPNAGGAGIWQANGGPAADASGNIYVVTGDGVFDAHVGGRDFGDSVLKIAPGGMVADYFTPWNQGALNANGLDLGSAGPLLLPDQPGAHPHLMVTAGKNNTIYVVDRDAMGRYSGTTSDGQIVQSLVDVFPLGTPQPGNFSAAVYFNGTVYFGPVADSIHAFPLADGRLRTTALTRSSDVFRYPGAAMSISAAGTSHGILWAVQRNGDCGILSTCSGAAPGALKAYDAADLGRLLYSSDQMGLRDDLDVAAKFSVPLVANGKVFIGSMGQLIVYGLLP
jgi:uncharacterized repeat protein (TIGR01451 family)